MCRATSAANASSEFRWAYSSSRSMSSVGILPIHLRRREKVTDYFYGRPAGNCFLTRRRFIEAARVNEMILPEPGPHFLFLKSHEQISRTSTNILATSRDDSYCQHRKQHSWDRWMHYTFYPLTPALSP